MFRLLCSLEISSKEMNIGAERLAMTLAKFAKEGKEVNIWRQFGGSPASDGNFLSRHEGSRVADTHSKRHIAGPVLSLMVWFWLNRLHDNGCGWHGCIWVSTGLSLYPVAPLVLLLDTLRAPRKGVDGVHPCIAAPCSSVMIPQL